MKVLSALTLTLIAAIPLCRAQSTEPILLRVAAPYPSLVSSQPILMAGNIYDPGSVNYGPVGTPLTLIGSGFGSSRGTVQFVSYKNGAVDGSPVRDVTISGWTTSSISIVVPSDAKTGLIEVVTVNGSASNGMPFIVTNGSYLGYCPATVVADTLQITTNSLSDGTVNTAYSAALTATGGSGNYNWVIIDGSLPDGLSLSPSGSISGTPALAEGPLSITVEVSDNGSTKQFADATLTLRIDDNWTSQSNAALYSFTTSYDSAGNVSSFTDSVTGQWSNIQYDSLGRLSLATQLPISGATDNWCWDYDIFGNRQHQQSGTGAGYSNSPGNACQLSSGGTLVSNQWADYTLDGTPNTADNGLNQLTGSPSGLFYYDGAGNTRSDPLNSYLYDGEGRICAMQNGTTMTQYIYDADGNRVAKGSISSFSCDITSNGFHPTTVYVLGTGGGQLSELTNTSSSQTPSWQFAHTNVYAVGQQIATYDADLSGQTEGNLYFHLSDWLGTRRQQTDYAGNPLLSFTSLPFGDGLSTIPISNTYAADDIENHYTGKERDAESGNDYFGERYFASTMGRFLSPDQGPWKLDDPQYFNMYSYALNNPLRYGDDEGDTAQDRVNKANQLATQNIPYVHGGGHPGNPNANCGLDCSGLVRTVFKADPDNTLNVNGSAAGEAKQFQAGGQYSTDINDAEPGDAIFFTDSSGAIVHTGIVVDIRDGKIYFVHAPRPGKNVNRFYIKISDPRLANENFAGVGRSNEAGHPTTTAKKPGFWQRVVMWVSSFWSSSNSGNSHPNPEGTPQRHKDVPCLKHRDGSCA